jgi:hypothetical protein
LKRLLSTGIPDKAAKEKIEWEISATLKRFSTLLERASSNLRSNEREELCSQFLEPSPSSFENVIALLDDFAKIKDFYLKERDAKGSL